VSFLVEENPARRRFEILVDDALAGSAEYELHGEVPVFTRTQVDERFRNMGVGSALIKGTLDQIRERGDRLATRCRFMSAYIERHPEYADLVVPEP
jgi:predicted GNAT family acetyltransferase